MAGSTGSPGRPGWKRRRLLSSWSAMGTGDRKTMRHAYPEVEAPCRRNHAIMNGINHQTNDRPMVQAPTTSSLAKIGADLALHPYPKKSEPFQWSSDHSPLFQTHPNMSAVRDRSEFWKQRSRGGSEHESTGKRSKSSKQAARQVMGSLRIVQMFATQIIIEHSSVRCLMRVGVSEIHPMAFNPS